MGISITTEEVVFVHMLNDFSGSPLVLKQVIDIAKKTKKITLITNSHSNGFLSNIEGIEYKYFTYSNHKSKWVTLFNFIVAQILIITLLFSKRKSDISIYINTLLPFGAAIFGQIFKKRVIFHLHETHIKPYLLKKFLVLVCDKSSNMRIYVSNYLREALNIPSENDRIIYNTVRSEIEIAGLSHTLELNNENDLVRIVMICSLKAYKGIDSFIALANKFLVQKKIKFILVLNASSDDCVQYFEKTSVPNNIEFRYKEKDIVNLLKETTILLNLSLPDLWVETFGLTVLEGMFFGIPVIAPNVGGPAEIIVHEKSGFLISAYQIDKIFETIYSLVKDKDLYKSISTQAKERAKNFASFEFEQKINSIFTT